MPRRFRTALRFGPLALVLAALPALLAACSASPCGIAGAAQYCPPPGPIDYAPIHYAPQGGHT